MGIAGSPCTFKVGLPDLRGVKARFDPKSLSRGCSLLAIQNQVQVDFSRRVEWIGKGWSQLAAVGQLGRGCATPTDWILLGGRLGALPP